MTPGTLCLATKRATGLVQVVIDEYCEIPDGTLILRTSCRRGDSLILEPDGTRPSSTRFKYVLAHEFGHFVQSAAQGLMSKNYGTGGGEPGEPRRSSARTLRLLQHSADSALSSV